MPDLGSIARYEVILWQLALYFLAFLVRYAGFGLHTNLFGRSVPGAHDEVTRVGSDLALMALGIFMGASAIKESVFHRYTVNIFKVSEVWCLVGFLIIYFVSYSLFLFLRGRQIPDIIRHPGLIVLLVLNFLFGWLALGGAGILAAPVLSITTK